MTSDGRGVGNAGRLHARTGLDAFAAAGAGIDHLVDARGKRGFERSGHGGLE